MRNHCLFILLLWTSVATDLTGQIKLPSLKSVLGKPDKPVVSDTSDLGKVLRYLEERSPVSTNFDNAIYESEVMADFEPAPDQYLPLELQPTAEKGGFKLRSGLYTMMAKSFCLKAGTYGPSRGDGHLYAPLAGRKREMVETILERYAKHPEIPQQKIQVLLWAIIARADVANLLKSEHFISLKKLFTLPELAKLFVVDLANQEIDNKINVLDSKMPPIVKKALHAEREIQNLLTSNPIYERLEQVAVLAGIAPAQDMIREVSRGRWSYHPDGYFVRFFPQGYQRTRVDVYVPNTGNVELDASGNQVLSHNARAQGDSKEVVFNPAKMVAVPANRSSQRIGVSPVPVEPTEPVKRDTVYGITIITHGFILGGSTHESDWMFSMAREIVNKYKGKIHRYNPKTGIFEPPFENGKGEKVLIFDWASESNFEGKGYSESAGDALFAALVRSKLDLKNLHFIGHSRGTVVNTECVLRLISAEIQVDQVTNLDPHDWGVAGIGDDHDNHPELPEIEFPGATLFRDHPGVVSWRGVGFSDTYYQDNGFESQNGRNGQVDCERCDGGLEGRRISGTQNKLWNYYDNKKICHTNIHMCAYIPTIGEINPGNNIESSGHSLSRLGGKYKKVPTGTVSVSNSFSFFNQIGNRIKGIMNGSFDRGALNSVPGWGDLHGGGGNAFITIGEKLTFRNKQWRKHNFFYVPVAAKHIKFKIKNTYQCPNSQLTVAISTGASEKILLTYSLKEVNDQDKQLNIDVTEFKGQVITLEFRTVGECSQQNLQLDDVELSIN